MYTTPYNPSGDIANILSFDNGYAWGGCTGYDSSPLHTAYALKVLTVTGKDTQEKLPSTLGFLNSAQNADGGWGFYKSDDSSTFITAQA